MEIALPTRELEYLAERFKILSEPSRLQILAALCDRERNVSDICDRTGLNQANASKHLQRLKSAGIVACRRVGVCRYYRVIDIELLQLCAKAKQTVRAPLPGPLGDRAE